MIETNPAPQPSPQPTAEPSRSRWKDILLLLFALIAILFLAGRGIYLVVTGVSASGPAASANQVSDIYGAISMFFVAVLVSPVLILSLRRLRGQSIRPAKVPPVKLLMVIGLVILWIVVLGITYLINTFLPSGWIIAAPFFLLGIAIPVAALVWIAIGGLPTGSWRRLWTALGMGMTISTTIAIGLELLFAALGLAAAGIIASIDPALRTTLEQLRNQIQGANNAQDLLPIITPYLDNPWLILVILLFVSGIGPLIEEAFKPLAVWLVGKHLRSPAEGFALGALCGAGFALLEGMLVSSGATDMVGFSVAARATSSLMHITASAFMGWAIASAILEKRYLRLFLTYLLSVGIHSLWNAAVVFTVYGGLRLSNPGSRLDLLGGLSVTAGIGLLVILVVGILVSLPVINRRLRSAPRAQNDIIAPNLS